MDNGKNESHIYIFHVIILNDWEDSDEDEDELLFIDEWHEENLEDDKDTKIRLQLKIMEFKQQKAIKENKGIKIFINIFDGGLQSKRASIIHATF